MAIARTISPTGDIHDLPPEQFYDEVHSFEFWFESVASHLAGTTWGRRDAIVDVAPPEPTRGRLVTTLCNYCVGEMAALEGASGLIAFAPDRRAKVFLATQAADEARHLEVFHHRLRDLGVDDPDAEIEARASRSLWLFRRRVQELVAEKDWEAALFAQNVILESLEFAIFTSHAADADPVTADVLRRVVKDERRHLGFGENELGRCLATAPHRRARLRQVRTELDHLIFAALAESARLIGAGHRDEERLGRAYVEAVERLGLHL
jgi:1,2-phenylacetyl-CoA epoxidase catalytic subunit